MPWIQPCGVGMPKRAEQKVRLWEQEGFAHFQLLEIPTLSTAPGTCSGELPAATKTLSLLL